MLLLYMASNQSVGLFDKPCKQENIVVKQLNGTFSLNQFVVQDMSNLNCCQYFAIDLSCLKDNDDEIINAIVGIKSMYDLRIIVLTIGYTNSNPLLGRLFAEGIYNIITATKTAEQQAEILKCITSGMEYKDAIKHRAQGNNSAKNQNRKSSRVIVQKQSIKQTISIGICGSLHRIGTTKQALHMAKYLNENAYTACYIEDNGHGHMSSLTEFYSARTENNLITMNGLDIYTSFDMAKILEKGYDFLIYDCGLFEETDKQQFLTRDIKLICAGSASWEAPCLIPIFKNIGDYGDIHFIFSFTPKNLQKEIRKLMGKFRDKSYFAEYSPELIDGFTNREIYSQIFKEYVENLEQQPQAKGFLGRFKQ